MIGPGTGVRVYLAWLPTSSSIRRSAAKPIISRNKSASALFSTSERTFIMSLVIGCLSVRLVLNNPTLPENTDGHLNPQNLHHVAGHDPSSQPDGHSLDEKVSKAIEYLLDDGDKKCLLAMIFVTYSDSAET
jgi:hypothetical protein